jgi:hypothetical protein
MRVVRALKQIASLISPAAGVIIGPCAAEEGIAEECEAAAVAVDDSADFVDCEEPEAEVLQPVVFAAEDAVAAPDGPEADAPLPLAFVFPAENAVAAALVSRAARAGLAARAKIAGWVSVVPPTPRRDPNPSNRYWLVVRAAPHSLGRSGIALSWAAALAAVEAEPLRGFPFASSAVFHAFPTGSEARAYWNSATDTPLVLLQ